ncbi:MAG: hypothetical protein ACTSWD_04930 [Candidatus Heimdallarchaeota archaeon]
MAMQALHKALFPAPKPTEDPKRPGKTGSTRKATKTVEETKPAA